MGQLGPVSMGLIRAPSLQLEIMAYMIVGFYPSEAQLLHPACSVRPYSLTTVQWCLDLVSEN